jgi:hypothetical protein
MLFVLGFIAGIILSACNTLILLYVFGRKQKTIEKAVERITEPPRGKGAIFMPLSDEGFAKKKIIEQNEAKGADTYLDQLL